MTSKIRRLKSKKIRRKKTKRKYIRKRSKYTKRKQKGGSTRDWIQVEDGMWIDPNAPVVPAPSPAPSPETAPWEPEPWEPEPWEPEPEPDPKLDRIREVYADFDVDQPVIVVGIISGHGEIDTGPEKVVPGKGRDFELINFVTTDLCIVGGLDGEGKWRVRKMISGICNLLFGVYNEARQDLFDDEGCLNENGTQLQEYIYSMLPTGWGGAPFIPTDDPTELFYFLKHLSLKSYKSSESYNNEIFTLERHDAGEAILPEYFKLVVAAPHGEKEYSLMPFLEHYYPTELAEYKRGERDSFSVGYDKILAFLVLLKENRLISEGKQIKIFHTSCRVSDGGEVKAESPESTRWRKLSIAVDKSIRCYLKKHKGKGTSMDEDNPAKNMRLISGLESFVTMDSFFGILTKYPDLLNVWWDNRDDLKLQAGIIEGLLNYEEPFSTMTSEPGAGTGVGATPTPSWSFSDYMPPAPSRDEALAYAKMLALLALYRSLY